MTTSNEPVIQELHYTAEQVKEVERLQSSSPITERKAKIRQVLKGPMCATCSAIPNFRLEHAMDGIMKIECFCSKCYLEVYQTTKNISINDVAEKYNCTKVEPGIHFGLGKKEYEQQ